MRRATARTGVAGTVPAMTSTGPATSVTADAFAALAGSGTDVLVAAGSRTAAPLPA